MASAAAAAARRLALNLRRFAPCCPLRGLAAYTTLTAAAAAAPSRGPTRLLRRGFSTIPGGGYTPAGPEQDDEEDEDLPLSCFNPTAPVDPNYYIQYDEKDLASEEALWALYERWRDFYRVERSRDEMLQRFGIFKDKARHIHEFNKSVASFTKALKDHADLTWKEYAKLHHLRGSDRL